MNGLSLLLLDVDSGSVSERVGYAVRSMQRGWAAQKETQARLDTVKSDRETIRGALDLRKQRCRDEHGQPAESGPLVLTLPQVPDGAVALVGDQTWRKVKVPGITMPCWQSSLTGPLDFGAVLDAEPNGVTVEMAPPREPRVWPKLDEAPDDITWLRGASGTRYGCDKLDEGIPVFRAINELTGESEGRSYSFHVLQFLDGPLTEVVES